MKKKAIALALFIATVLGFQMDAQAANIEAGREAFETCRGCHSIPGYSNVYPTYYVPKLGGQVPAYSSAALKAYKESSRSHRPMMANSYNLSEQKMGDIAAYLAQATGGSKQSNSNGGDIAKGKILAETCLSCHNDDTAPGASNPRLAGQHANYLEKAMKDYQSGKRKNALMKSMVEGLSEEQIKDISAYFTSLQGLVTIE